MPLPFVKCCYLIPHRSSLLLLTLILSITPAHAQSTTCSESHGAIERNFYDSALLGIKMAYSVYLPPCYDAENGSYPVIYLMHGSNDDDGQWGRLGLHDLLDRRILRRELPPLVVVMPFGGTVANENRFDQYSWANVFLTELMPLAESQYRIDTRRETRVIGGISRGGFWAFYIAFKNPMLFIAVGGHSPFFDLYHAPPQDNPLDLALSAPEIDSLRMWLDRGGQDFAEPGVTLMHERLTERGLAHDYIVNPEGQHANAYWSQHISEYMDFYAQDWPLPDAPEISPIIPENGIDLFLPIVSFPSLQTTIGRDRLQAVFKDQFDSNLVLTDEVAMQLRSYGVILAADTRIVPTVTLSNILWRDRDAYSLLPFDQLTPHYRVLNLIEADDSEIHPLDTDLTQYPFAFASESPNFYPNRLTRLLLSGVTALTRNTTTALDEHGIEWAGEAIKSYVTHADFFHISNEVSMYPTCPESDEPLLGDVWSFCSKLEHFALLTDLDVDIVELSGNHNNDYGFNTYLDTLDFYRTNRILTVGGGATLEDARQPLILVHNGNTIALLSCNWIGPTYALADKEKNQPGAAFCDKTWLAETLPTLAAENDLLVVTVQYQEFEQYTPTDRQRFDFRALGDLGADVVIGTQAHKPQTFEFYTTNSGGESFIHYGLGNLFFDQDFWGNKRFFMDELYIYDGRLLTVDVFTGIIDDLARPRPMTHDERLNFLQFMFIQQNGF